MSPPDSLDTLISHILTSTRITALALSPSASQALYALAPTSQPSSAPEPTSALWLSALTPGSTARQLTSGLANDTAPAWAADEAAVFFLSDRHRSAEEGKTDKPGPAAVYCLPLTAGGEAYPLTPTSRTRPVSAFWPSPDGRCIAYACAAEPSAEDKQREKEKDDGVVFGDARPNAQLHMLDLASRQVRRLPLGAHDAWHVHTAVWAPDARSVVLLAKQNAALEFNEGPIAVLRVSALPAAAPAAPQVSELGTLPRLAAGLLLSPAQDTLVTVQSFVPAQLSSSSTLYLHGASAGRFAAPARRYGAHEDVAGVVDVHAGGEVAVALSCGVDTRIDVVGADGTARALYATDADARSGAYAVGVNAAGEYVLVMVRSSGPRGEPAELWAGSVPRAALGEAAGGGAPLKLAHKLSNHNAWVGEAPRLSVEVVRYAAEDGTALEGVVTWMRDGGKEGERERERKGLPTVLFPHGGPYHRDVPGLEPGYWSKELLAWAGYLVLCPNYHGGSGRGNAFARCAHGQMGTHDWGDTYALLTHALAQGWADKERLALAGWSQGGFLTAWGVGQTKDVFKAAVMGAGVADWGAMGAESDLPEFEADLAGSFPWSAQRVDQAGSPIAHVSGVRTAVLVIHGEKDARVPASQGIMFHRGLRRESGCAERHTLVVYPREPHGFKERKHVEDVMRRTVGHLDAWLRK